MGRTATREFTFKFLYELEVTKDCNDESIDLYIQNNDIEDEETKEYIKKIAKGIEKHNAEIEKLISNNLKEKWELNRLSKVDIALLKLAVYEIKFEDLPYKVAINEVVEFAKKYSEDTSPSFINGVLAGIVNAKEK